jgi:hypothetical protein
VEPEPAVAPVIPPVMVPMVHEKVLAVFAVRLIAVLLSLQIVAELGVVTKEDGFTVTVIVEVDPIHPPVNEVGVTT